MSDALVTQAQLEGLLRKIRLLEQRIGRTEVRESPQFESGSFTPTWVGVTTPGTFTYTVNQTLVEWTRIGNRLHYNGRIVITVISVAPVGALTIAGFPYAAVADASMSVAGGGAMIAWAINVAAGYTDVNLQFANGATSGNLLRSGDNVAIANVQGGELIVGDCRFAGSYRIA